MRRNRSESDYTTSRSLVRPKPRDWQALIMALSFLLVLAATVILIRPETPVTKALHQNSLECCSEKQRGNNSCSNDTHCEPGCFLRVLENSNTVCIFCDLAAVDLDNITVCTYRGPGVAASLLLGTLLISLFLILSVASFFYLKRSNRLPNIFSTAATKLHIPTNAEAKICQKGAARCNRRTYHIHHPGL
ncbi:hypothetical protein F7725_017005 [Dissostichus mawsoni]|uniref:Uncharacterized protein n=1 Tax=Dissostichus mawsoni TaxID=36200 RepID=A0A7J5Z378_DISMA|nr:hypothetical protein F7725_017005 [Dissostichus mawsoni]